MARTEKGANRILGKGVSQREYYARGILKNNLSYPSFVLWLQAKVQRNHTLIGFSSPCKFLEFRKPLNLPLLFYAHAQRNWMQLKPIIKHSLFRRIHTHIAFCWEYASTQIKRDAGILEDSVPSLAPPSTIPTYLYGVRAKVGSCRMIVRCINLRFPTKWCQLNCGSSGRDFGQNIF